MSITVHVAPSQLHFACSCIVNLFQPVCQCVLYRFHEVFHGSAVTHRITRLQPDTEYALKIAAVSPSGQGDWSDHVTFMTTPTPPVAPASVVLKQVSNDMLQLDWRAVDFPHPLIYEAQYRLANSNQDYQQVSGSQWALIRIQVCFNWDV